MNIKFWSAGFLLIPKVYAVIASPFRTYTDSLYEATGNQMDNSCFFRMEVYHDMNVEVCKYYLSPARDIDRWWQQWSDFRSGKLRLSWVLRLKS